jgi:hypothetical protein
VSGTGVGGSGVYVAYLGSLEEPKEQLAVDITMIVINSNKDTFLVVDI